MADTWTTQGYPAMSEMDRERARMMQKILLEQGTLQNVNPAPPTKPLAGPEMDRIAPEPEYGSGYSSGGGGGGGGGAGVEADPTIKDMLFGGVSNAGPPPSQSPTSRPRLPQLSEQQIALMRGAKRPEVPTDIPMNLPPALPPGLAPEEGQNVADMRPLTGEVRPQMETPDGQNGAPMPQQQIAQGGVQPESPEQSQSPQDLPPEIASMTEVAKVNVAERPEEFATKAKGWMEKLGNVFALKTEGQDPKAINDAYGVPNAMVWEAQRSSLFNAGILLMAAGQPNTPSGRAQLIAKIGPALSGISSDIYKASQVQYMMNGGKSKTTLTANQNDYDRAVSQGYKGSFVDFQREVKGMTAEAGLTKELASGWADPKNGGYNKAKIHANSIDVAEEMISLLDEGTSQGLLSWAEEKALKGLVAAGQASPEQEAKLVRTQQIKSMVTARVLPLMQMLGGSDSNEELRKLTEAIWQQDWTPEAAIRNLRRATEYDRRDLNRLVEERKNIQGLAPGSYMPPEARAPYVPKNFDDGKYYRKPEPAPSGGEGGGGSEGGKVTLTEGKIKQTPAGHRITTIGGQVYIMRKGSNSWEPYNGS